MALGNNISASSIKPTVGASANIAGAPINNAGLRNINPGVKGEISSLTDFLSANVNPDKPITKEALSEAIKSLNGNSVQASVGEALANFAPTETTQKDSTADAKAKQATAETHNKFAFNLPGQGRQEQAKEQNQDFLKNLSGNDWMNTGASLT